MTSPLDEELLKHSHSTSKLIGFLVMEQLLCITTNIYFCHCNNNKATKSIISL